MRIKKNVVWTYSAIFGIYSSNSSSNPSDISFRISWPIFSVSTSSELSSSHTPSSSINSSRPRLSASPIIFLIRVSLGSIVSFFILSPFESKWQSLTCCLSSFVLSIFVSHSGQGRSLELGCISSRWLTSLERPLNVT